jgi:hypothetical protein
MYLWGTLTATFPLPVAHTRVSRTALLAPGATLTSPRSPTMIEFTCPDIGYTVHVEPRGLISAHRTAKGAVGYARCACGGLTVLSATGAGPGGWEAVSHGVGPLVRDATAPAAA